MYYYLRGRLAVLTNDTAVIDCGGVGYCLSVPASTVSALSAQIEKEVTVFTHLSVREDAMELYGFATERERELFRKLLTVSGIGPKAAGAILGTLTVEEFFRACAEGDYKTISRAPGVGGKTAQRVILELKDKLGSELPVSGGTAPGRAVGESGGAKLAQMTDTLTLYGFSREQIRAAAKELDMDLPLEELIAETLRRLAKNG